MTRNGCSPVYVNIANRLKLGEIGAYRAKPFPRISTWLRTLTVLTKTELIAEIRRLNGEPEPSFKELYGLVKINRKPKKPIFAGMDLLKDDLLVVDEKARIAYVHPEVKTVPNKIRIHGYAARAFKKGEQVRIRHWLNYDPK